jgi:hypothetical protein
MLYREEHGRLKPDAGYDSVSRRFLPAFIQVLILLVCAGASRNSWQAGGVGSVYRGCHSPSIFDYAEVKLYMINRFGTEYTAVCSNVKIADKHFNTWKSVRECRGYSLPTIHLQDPSLQKRFSSAH